MSSIFSSSSIISLGFVPFKTAVAGEAVVGTGVTEQVALCDQVVDVAVLSEVDKGRQVPVGLGGLDGTVVGGGDVAAGAGAGEAVVGAGVTEQVVDRLGLAVPVDGCAEGERLADGGLTIGEGGPLHAVPGV